MTKQRYDHHFVEKKWQRFWKENKTFEAHLDKTKPKYYVLDMFPYPSGAGLHVGHVVGYTATDIMARYKRHKGFNVLHPMGWDSFGLPAEQYAVRTGTHPAITTKHNIDTYRTQLQSLGFSYDWSREIATSDPDYYKWTQWIFTLLYEKGLAYEAEMLVNYCPALGTALSNEEIENGRAKEGGHLIERRPLKQWILKITAYADRLLEDLNQLDWPEGLKRLQRNWIGKSEGALIDFALKGHFDKVQVFTTCPETLFGVSYLVLAPEHPLVNQITIDSHKDVVKAYQQATASKSDLERTELCKEKSGVFTGAYVYHPVTEELLPVWIADYVLGHYACGAVMGVPAHDERDEEFATRFSLPIRPVIENDRCLHSAHGDLSLNGLSIQEGKKAVCNWLEKHHKGKLHISYKLRDWLFSRQRYWGEPFPILHFEDGTKRILALDELPLCPPQVEDYRPSSDGQSPLAKVRQWVELFDEKTNKRAFRETNTMPQWAGSCWYYLRFCDPKNNQAAWSLEAENYWMPVDLYVGGAEHAVLHLLYARFWHKVLFDLKLVSTCEPFAALRNQGMVTSRSFQNEFGAYVPLEDVVEEGDQWRHKETGALLRSQIEKMSKSKLNGMTPDEMVDQYGADALRIYEMFMGPIEKEKIWNTEAVQGAWRFLNRFWELVDEARFNEEAPSEAAFRAVHRLVHQATEEIEALRFNTAISKMMEFVNAMTPIAHYPKKVMEMAVLVLSPFAPHIAEEMWKQLGHTESLAFVAFPIADSKWLAEDTITYPVQVNGKLRTTITVQKGTSKEQVLALAEREPIIEKYLATPIKKVVFVPDKLVNFVI